LLVCITDFISYGLISLDPLRGRVFETAAL
jgi:hypothetical protein